MSPSADVHVEALAWALVAFLWQGTLVALAVAGLMRLARTAQARYAIGIAGMVAMLAAPILTYASRAVALERPTMVRTTPKPIVLLGGAVTGVVLADDPRQAASLDMAPARGDEWGAPIAASSERPSEVATLANPIIVTMWLAGVALLTLRLLGGWIVARRMARLAFGPADARLQALAADVARRLHLTRAVTIVDSAAVVVPTVVGWVKPVVLMPACGLSGLSACQLEAILAHELAHVRRHDYLLNLLQSAVETLLFYHPAVWWVSQRVRAEREHCCDDLAVDVCGDRVAYVSALAQLAALDAAPRLALAATDGSVLARVARLLGEPSRGREWPSASLVLCLLAATVIVSSASAGLLSATPARETADIEDREAMPDAAPAPQAEIASPRQAARALLPVPEAPPAPPAPSVSAVPPVPSAPPAAPNPPSVTSVPAVSNPASPPSPTNAPSPASPPSPLSPAIPPSPPSPASPPSAPSLPAVPSEPADIDEAQADGHGDVSWSNGRERFHVEWTGTFTLTDDDRDVASVENGATVKVSEGRLFTTRIELRGLSDGRIERRFYRNGFERPYEPEGQRWLASTLSRLVERSGLFVEQRVARLLKIGGVEAVYTAIDRLPSDSGYVRRRYYQELLAQTPHTAALLGRITERVAHEGSSDYERALVLKRVAASPTITDVERAAVAAASSTMRSDYEQRRVLTSVMTDAVSEPVASAILGAATSLDSDYERTQVLMAIAGRGGVTPATSERYLALAAQLQSAYEQRKALAALADETRALDEAVARRAVQVAAAIESDYERRQALQRLLARHGTISSVRTEALASMGSFESSHERSVVLLVLLQRGGLTDETAAPFFKAAAGLSPYEHRRVLEAALERPLSSSTLVGLLGNAGQIGSEYERGRVLQLVASTQTLTPEARARYLDVADTLRSEHEQTRALAALVRAERKSAR